MSTTARFSLEEYDRIVESGALDRRRLELIRGEILEMTPIGPRHEDVVDVLNRWSTENLSNQQARIRIQHSIGLPEVESAPAPDVAWVSPRRYATGRPQTAEVLLVIEVADGSLSYDRGHKAAAYAEAGLADYWIVNLRDRVLEVRREPQQGGYRDLSVYSGDDEVRPLAFPEVVLRPSMLWEE